MLFKDELPPPRHTLDAGDFSDSDANVEITHEIDFELPTPSPERLLLLAPKCADFAVQIGGTPRGRIVVSTTRRSTALQTATADFLYESENVDNADFTSTNAWQMPVYEGPSGLLVIVAAALPEEEAAYAGKAIVTRLSPKSLVVATPGLSFMTEPVCCLATPGAELPRGVPLATPPVLVQGTGAAALSRARQLDIPAVGLVVSGDGPANHEIVDEYKFDLLRESLFPVLGLRDVAKSRVERDISTLYV